MFHDNLDNSAKGVHLIIYCGRQGEWPPVNLMRGCAPVGLLSLRNGLVVSSGAVPATGPGFKRPHGPVITGDS